MGDLLKSSKGKLKPMRAFVDWNTSLSKESIKNVAELHFKWICPAHGEPIEKSTIDIN